MVANNTRSQKSNDDVQTQTPSILERIASGNVGAISECIAQYRGLIAYIGRRSMADATELDDAIQEVLISIWKNAARFDRSRGTESTFISTIARRHFIDRHRRRRNRPENARITREMEACLASNDAGYATYDDSPASEILESATPQERAVLQLVYAHENSFADAARSLNMPVGTVKSIAHRGLNRLRREARLVAA